MLRSFSSFYTVVLSVIFLTLQACSGGDGSKPSQSDIGNLSDFRLATLEVDAGALQPAFDPGNLGPYKIDVGSDVNAISISGTSMVENRELRVVLLNTQGENGSDDPDMYKERTIASGGTDTRTLNPGDNRIRVSVFKSGERAHLDYQLVVHRESLNGRLSALDIKYLQDNGSVKSLEITPEFSADVKSYTGSLPYGACYMAVEMAPYERHTQISLNGQVTQERTVHQAIEFGEQTLQFDTLAESGGDAHQYTLSLTRAAGTESEVANDATLASFTATNASVIETFYCSNQSLEGFLNSDQSVVTLSATPTSATATMRVGTPVWKTVAVNGSYVNTIVDLEDDAVDIEAAVPVTLPIDEEKEETTVSRAIKVTSANGEKSRFYQISLKRLESNLILVSTTNELQAALLNAQPGDDIVIEPGVYSGVASLSDSGHEQAHFYSAQDGSAEKQIRLRGKSSNDPADKVILKAAGDAKEAVLRLDGDFWRVSDIELTGAQVGVVLDNAANNTIEDAQIYDVSAQGVILRNGSNHNVIRDNKVYATGQEGVVVGSDAEFWDIAPTGTEIPQNDGNVIQFNVFGPDIAAEMVDVKEGATSTLIQSNTFEDVKAGDLTEASSVIVVKGNETDISYNTFLGENAGALATLVTTKAIQRDWVTELWGRNSRFYQNWVNLDGLDIPLVYSDTAFKVADNLRLDNGSVSYSGTGIDDNFSTPSYLLKLASDNAECVGDYAVLSADKDRAAAYENKELTFLALAGCAQPDVQVWTFTHAGGGFMYLSPAGWGSGDNGRIVAPITDTLVLPLPRSLGQVASGIAYNFEQPSVSYNRSWKPLYRHNGVIFENRQTWSGLRTLVALDSADESLIYVQSSAEQDNQIFLLEEQ